MATARPSAGGGGGEGELCLLRAMAEPRARAGLRRTAAFLGEDDLLAFARSLGAISVAVRAALGDEVRPPSDAHVLTTLRLLRWARGCAELPCLRRHRCRTRRWRSSR